MAYTEFDASARYLHPCRLDGHASEEADPCDSGDRPTRQLSRSLTVCPATPWRSGGGPCFGTVLGAVLANAAQLCGGAPALRAGGQFRGYKLNNRDWRITHSVLRAYLDGQACDVTEPPSETREVIITAWRKVWKA